MLRILKKRYPLTNVVLLPVRVQGAEAPAEIAYAIRYANRHKLADLLIVGRGGGSIEDLWAFNDEQVAYAIYESDIPVISAVGHEPDVTISDYVADLRAATPSNAAELAVPDKDGLRQTLDSMLSSMQTVVLKQLKASRQHLNVLAGSPTLKNPLKYIHQRRDVLRLNSTRLVAQQQRVSDRKRQQFISLTAKLDAMSPLKVLTRGYAMVQSQTGDVIRSVKMINIGENVNISLEDGIATAQISQMEEREL
jgi:exodeoxyribonuclease VII large subunit